MVKKTVRLLIVTICISVLFSGCSLMEFFTAEKLIRPPKLTGEHAALQTAFEEAVGKDIGLYTPIAGNHRGSYILFDANNDSVDEAVVLYSSDTNSSAVHMHLLSQKDGEWYSVADITGSGTEVYKVDFMNIDSGRMLEIVVIWSVDDSKREKTLSVFRISSLDASVDNALSSIATVQIIDYVYFDVDIDNDYEILYLFQASSEQNYSLSARLLDFNEEKELLVPLSDVSFKSNISYFSQITYENTKEQLRVYLDCASPENDYFTEMLVFSKSDAVLFIPDFNGKPLAEITRRTEYVLCTDFNADGTIDIPCVFRVEDSCILSDRPENITVPLFVEWLTYSDDVFKASGKYFINEADGYALRYDSFAECYYIVYDSINRITQLRLKNGTEENNIVFSVSRDDEDSYAGILGDGILGEGFLGNKESVKCNVVVTALGESLSFTESYIKSLLLEL